MTEKPKESRIHLRGFASMSPERRREVAAQGGAAVPSEKRGFNNKELAVSAGRKGGLATKAGKGKG